MADIIARFKGDTSDLDNKLKNATRDLGKLTESCKKAGTSLDKVSKDDVQFARSLGTMQTQAKTAKGKISELTNSFTEASVIYKRLTDEEKRSPFGKALAQSLDQLKGRIREAKTEMNAIQSELGGGIGNFNASGIGDFRSILGDVGGQLGMNSQLLTAVTSGTAALGVAIGGTVTAVAAAAQAWNDYNSELAKQDQVTSVTLGIDGSQVAEITDYARSLVDVYGVDFREAINGINTLMTQFGVSAEDAMDIMSKGMQGMIQGDCPKLLNMIQQYAPSFRDAGVSASELVAVIHNTEGGIFTDANMQSITMGIKNIRLMKDSTKDALKSIGVDADDMMKKLNDGSITIFEALQQVSEALTSVDSGSKAAGEVMQNVFGRQGATAGQNLSKAISELNTNLDQTSRQTGAVGQKLGDLQKAHQRLSGVMREMFGLNATGWEEMKMEIEAKAINAIVDFHDKISDLINTFPNLWEAAKTTFSNILGSLGPLSSSISHILSMLSLAKAESDDLKSDSSSGNALGDLASSTAATIGKIANDNLPTYTSKDGKFKSKDKDAVDRYNERQANINKYTNTGKTTKGGKTKTDTLGDTMGSALRNMNAIMTEDQIMKLRVEPELKGGDSDILKELTKDGTNKLVAAESLFGVSTSSGVPGAKNKKPIKDPNEKKNDKNNESIMKNTGEFVSGLSGIQGGLEGLGLDLGEGFSKTITVMQSILAVITGIQAIVSVIEALSAADSIPFFATGGVVRAANGYVPGNHFSGDMVPALLNSGELVLNKAQQGNLASQLNGNNFLSNLSLETSIREDKLVVMLNNGLRKRGKGTLVTSRR